jgi:hypothetical protein
MATGMPGSVPERGQETQFHRHRLGPGQCLCRCWTFAAWITLGVACCGEVDHCRSQADERTLAIVGFTPIALVLPAQPAWRFRLTTLKLPLLVILKVLSADRVSRACAG